MIPKRSVFTLLLLAALPSLLSGMILLFIYNHQEFLISQNPLHTALFFTFTVFTMAFAITPTTFIAILTGYFYSWSGMIYLVITYLLASVLGLYFGKALSRTGLFKDQEKSEQLGKLRERMNNRQFLFIVFARLSPVLPFAMTNVALSNLKIKWKDYLAGSLIGMLPRTFISFLAGKNARDIWTFIQHPSPGGFYKLIPVVLIIISTIGMLKILKKRSPLT